MGCHVWGKSDSPAWPIMALKPGTAGGEHLLPSGQEHCQDIRWKTGRFALSEDILDLLGDIRRWGGRPDNGHMPYVV